MRFGEKTSYIRLYPENDPYLIIRGTIPNDQSILSAQEQGTLARLEEITSLA
jgi:hypothetical protein